MELPDSASSNLNSWRQARKMLYGLTIMMVNAKETGCMNSWAFYRAALAEFASLTPNEIISDAKSNPVAS